MSLPLYLYHMPKTHHAMKWFRLMSQWTPKDNPPLPTTETNLRSGPDAVFICNSYVWKDEHGRAIKYGSQANSATNLSCVFIGASSPPVACFGQIKFVLEYDKTVLYTSVYSPSELLSCSTGVQGGVAATSLSTAEKDASSLSVNDMGILLEHHLQSCCLHNIKNSTAIVLYLD